MARRGSKDRGQRDDISPSLAELLAPPFQIPAPIRVTTPLPEAFHEVEDNRRYTPERFREAFTVGGTPAPSRRIPQSRGLSSGIAFDDPRSTIRCVRRKQRREVIFAKRKRKKGSGAARRRRNFWSNIQC